MSSFSNGVGLGGAGLEGVQTEPAAVFSYPSIWKLQYVQKALNSFFLGIPEPAYCGVAQP